MSELTENSVWYVHHVEDGIVFGLTEIDHEDWMVEIPLEEVPECQRSYLGIGSIFRLLNGKMLIDKTLWSSHEIECVDRRAAELWKSLGWARADGQPTK